MHKMAKFVESGFCITKTALPGRPKRFIINLGIAGISPRMLDFLTSTFAAVMAVECVASPSPPHPISGALLWLVPAGAGDWADPKVGHVVWIWTHRTRLFKMGRPGWRKFDPKWLFLY